MHLGDEMLRLPVLSISDTDHLQLNIVFSSNLQRFAGNHFAD